jgi:hypothetical protein
VYKVPIWNIGFQENGPFFRILEKIAAISDHNIDSQVFFVRQIS